MNWNYKDRIVARVMDYYIANPPVNEQILHTQAVASYTRAIAVMEGWDAARTEMIEIAAWLHDIGCPSARNIYGNSKPVHQQTEGEKLVYEWFENDTELQDEDKQWLAQVVGHHHQRPQAEALHFEPLYDADLIVNLWEGYYDKSQAKEKFQKLVCTESGMKLFNSFFVNDK